MSAPADAAVFGSETERREAAIVAALRKALPNDVLVDVQPDDPRAFDMSGANRVVLVHFLEEMPVGHRFHGAITFAVICLARSYRGVGGGQNLREAARDALTGRQLEGMSELKIVRSRTEGRVGGLWRWVVEIRTEAAMRRLAAEPARFTEQFPSEGTTL